MGELHINLLGTSFSIKATEDSKHLEKLLGYYKNIVNDVSKIPAVKNNSLQTSILAGLMLCDELYKAKMNMPSQKQSEDNINKNETDKMQEKIKEIANKMIEQLDSVLDTTENEAK